MNEDATLIGADRLKLLTNRRTELSGLITAFEHKPESARFLDEVANRIVEIDLQIADIESHRAWRANLYPEPMLY